MSQGLETVPLGCKSRKASGAKAAHSLHSGMGGPGRAFVNSQLGPFNSSDNGRNSDPQMSHLIPAPAPNTPLWPADKLLRPVGKVCLSPFLLFHKGIKA